MQTNTASEAAVKQKRIETLEAKLSMLEDAQQSLTEVQAQLKLVQESETSRTTDIDRLTVEAENHTKTIAGLQESIRKHNIDVQDLRKQLQDANNLASQGQRDLDELRHYSAYQENEVAEEQEKTKAAKERKNRYKHERSHVVSQLEPLQDRVQQQGDEIQGLQAELDELREEDNATISKLREELRPANNTVAQLREGNSELSGLRGDLITANTKIAELERQDRESKESTATQNKTAQNLQRDLEAANGQVALLTSKVAEQTETTKNQVQKLKILPELEKKIQASTEKTKYFTSQLQPVIDSVTCKEKEFRETIARKEEKIADL